MGKSAQQQSALGAGMHPTAMMNCRRFFDCYGSHYPTGKNARIVEIGSLDVNGSLRRIAESQFEYIGVDFSPGSGVDVVLTDPYSLPFPDSSVDIVLSSSCFEHSEMFWLVFLEVMRILKSRGLFYLNAPSNGVFHRYPVDCWRFYPDSGNALVAWAHRNHINAALLESYTSRQRGSDGWNDFVAVFLKDRQFETDFPSRITDTFMDFTNGFGQSSTDLLNSAWLTEDQTNLQALAQLVRDKLKNTSANPMLGAGKPENPLSSPKQE
jgi:SAM-dependent methyltransferase